LKVLHVSNMWPAPGIPLDPSLAPSPAAARGETWRRLARRSLLVAFGVLGGAAVSYFLVDREEDPRPGASLSTAPTAPPTEEQAPAPAAEPSPSEESPEGAAEVPGAGRLAVDFEHPLKTGQLRIWLDGELIVEQRLAGQASKKGLVFSVRKGSYRDMLEVPPGRHTLRVQVAWDESERTERIASTFKAGETRRLQVRLGRLRKNLSLEWE
jgi:pyruvate/2-oxoglutarate dehydrogenase complex dihydrolipoamide acyltransferase (E2) component